MIGTDKGSRYEIINPFSSWGHNPKVGSRRFFKWACLSANIFHSFENNNISEASINAAALKMSWTLGFKFFVLRMLSDCKH